MNQLPKRDRTRWKKKKKKKEEWKVLPSDNNSPYRTDYPGETESGESGDETGRK